MNADSNIPTETLVTPTLRIEADRAADVRTLQWAFGDVLDESGDESRTELALAYREEPWPHWWVAVDGEQSTPATSHHEMVLTVLNWLDKSIIRSAHLVLTGWAVAIENRAVLIIGPDAAAIAVGRKGASPFPVLSSGLCALRRGASGFEVRPYARPMVGAERIRMPTPERNAASRVDTQNLPLTPLGTVDVRYIRTSLPLGALVLTDIADVDSGIVRLPTAEATYEISRLDPRVQAKGAAAFHVLADLARQVPSVRVPAEHVPDALAGLFVLNRESEFE